jgi:leucyl/phenylalanyl-tRNA--protein transferase
MFSRQTNASKIALVYLCRHIAKLGFKLIDCQLETEHLVSMGAKAIKRKTFLTMLHQLRDSDIKWNPEGYIPTPSD